MIIHLLNNFGLCFYFNKLYFRFKSENIFGTDNITILVLPLWALNWNANNLFRNCPVFEIIAKLELWNIINWNM